MAIDYFSDAIPVQHAGLWIEGIPEDLRRELREIHDTIQSLIEIVPQVAEVAPAVPRRGIIRFAVSPWDPGSGTNKWYWYTGTAWALL